MLFQINFVFRASSSAQENQESLKRALALFAKWSPPAGMELKSFYSRADGRGGSLIVEADDAKVLMDGPAKFGAINEFEIVPVLDISEAVPVLNEGAAWIDRILPPGF